MIKYGWMNWDEIKPFKAQLIEMEHRLIQKYHYPNRSIPVSYSRESVDRLERHMESGNTFFWAITDGDTLVGYYWAYIADFLFKKRWVLRSLMINENYKHQGYGKLAVNEGLKKASELGCYDAVTEYVPMNESAGSLYHNSGYEVSRIEVVKKL